MSIRGAEALRVPPKEAQQVIAASLDEIHGSADHLLDRIHERHLGHRLERPREHVEAPRIELLTRVEDQEERPPRKVQADVPGRSQPADIGRHQARRDPGMRRHPVLGGLTGLLALRPGDDHQLEVAQPAVRQRVERRCDAARRRPAQRDHGGHARRPARCPRRALVCHLDPRWASGDNGSDPWQRRPICAISGSGAIRGRGPGSQLAQSGAGRAPARPPAPPRPLGEPRPTARTGSTSRSRSYACGAQPSESLLVAQKFLDHVGKRVGAGRRADAHPAPAAR